MDCLFCKFARHQKPKNFTYEDSDLMVIPDIHPRKPIHFLIVPKNHIPTFSHLQDDVLLGKIRKIAQQLIKEKGLEEKGYQIVINGGGLQVIDHLHFHLTGPWKSKGQ